MENLILYNFTSTVEESTNTDDFIYAGGFYGSVKYNENSYTITVNKGDSNISNEFPESVEVTEMVKPQFGYLQHENLFFIIDTNKILLINNDLTSHQVFNFPKKALAFQFAPLEENFAVCFHDGRVSCYSSPFWNGNWDCCTSTGIWKPTHVDLGWGSSQTQFKGKRQTKASSDLKEEETAYKNTDERTTLAWRGNGTMFGVNFFDQNLKSRIVRMYLKDCTQIGEFKEFANLESTIAFRAEGQSIGIIANVHSKQKLVVLGYKGYVHKEFPLHDVGQCLELKWDKNNSCLGISRVINGYSVVDLFLEHDYRWNCKRRIILKNDKLRKFEFLDSPERTIQLRIYCVDNSYQYTFLMKPTRTVHKTKKCSITINIKDRSCETFYYYKDYASYEPIILTFKNQINDIIFDLKSTKVAFIDCENIVHMNSYVDIEEQLNWNGGFKYITAPYLENSFFFDEKHNLQYIGLSVQHKNGYRKVSDKVTCQPPASKSIIIEFIYINEKTQLFLDVDGDLYYNQLLYRKNVSSIYTYDNFLIYIEKCNTNPTFHTLHYVELNSIEETINIKKSTFSHRPVEQFAKILNIVPESGIVILYFPRGNIEHVTVTIFKLIFIKKMIEQLQFKEAFTELHKSSLPLNYIYQLSQEKFLTYTEEFIQKLKNEEINAIIKTTNPEFNLSDFESENILKIGRLLTVNDIMSHLRNKILYCKDYQLFLPTLCLIKLHDFKENTITYDIRNALTEISNICRGNFRSHNAAAKAALKEIVHITSPQEVYNTSFLINDLHLVQFVLDNVQIDPQFELKEIGNYKCMSESLRRAKICANKNEKHNAIKYYYNAYKNGEITKDELITYCDKLRAFNYLYMEVDEKDKELFALVSNHHARYLQENKNYLDAGVVYFKNKKYEFAFSNFMREMHFEKVMLTVKKLPVEKQKAYVRRFIGELIEKGLYAEVGIIYETFLNDKNEALRYYIEGGKYDSALKLATDEEYQEIELHLESYFNKMIKKVDEVKVLHHENFNRLKEVREEKLAQKTYDDFDDHPEEHCSLYQESLISGRTKVSTRNSTRSFRTSRTSRTNVTDNSQMSRNERKQAKKYLHAKKGSQYEDIAIMYQLYRNTCSVYKLYAELFNNVKIFNMISHSRSYTNVFTKLGELQKQVREDAKIIWCEEDYYSVDETNNVIYDNILLLDPIYRHEPRATFDKYAVLKSLGDDK